MKRTMKYLAALTLTVAMVATLAGCDTLGTTLGDLTGGKIDGVTYMQGQMDELYLGKFNKDFLEMVETTEEEAQKIYDEGMEAEVLAFNYYYTVEYPTEEYNARMADLYKQAYAKADYTVVSSAKQDDESYSVKITVRPLDIIQLVNEQLGTFTDELNAKYADLDFDAMSEDEYNDWYENTYDLEYQNGLADLFESLIPSIGYMPEKSIAVQIEKDPDDGYYTINDESFDNMDKIIIDYTDNT